MGKSFSSLLEPIITEKSTSLSKHNKYTFKVLKNASKNDIKNDFSNVFPGRKIKSIRVLKLKGHAKRTKSGIKFPIDGKKAILTIEGPKIEFFPEVS